VVHPSHVLKKDLEFRRMVFDTSVYQQQGATV